MSEWNSASLIWSTGHRTTGREGKLGLKRSKVGHYGRGRKGSLKESCGPCPGQRNREAVLSALGLCCLVMGERNSKRWFPHCLPCCLFIIVRITPDKSATCGRMCWGSDCSPVTPHPSPLSVLLHPKENCLYDLQTGQKDA